jgi:diguanylate cyclase (GGDEF)-like protein
MPSPIRLVSLPISTPTPASLAERIVAALASWSRRRGVRPEATVEEFAGLLAEAAGPEVIASNLVRLAQQAAGPGAVRSELWRGRFRVAAWPEGPDPGVASVPFDFPLRCCGEDRGTLRVLFDCTREFDPDRRRRLATLAVLAAAADRGRDRESQAPATVAVTEEPAAAHPTHDPMTGLPNAVFLDTFLGYALALADRRDEPLSLIYIGVDRLAAIQGLHGPVVAGEALRKVGRTIARSLRSSDLIARLDDGRLVAVLPGTPGSQARRLSETLRATVASACVATPTMPVLTVSIGVASFPESAADVVTLRSAAAAALSEARACGRDRVASATPARLTKAMPTLRIVQGAG